MATDTDNRIGWSAILIAALLLACAFAVPILGALRASGARIIIAIAILIAAAGLALLIEVRGSA